MFSSPVFARNARGYQLFVADEQVGKASGYNCHSPDRH